MALGVPGRLRPRIITTFGTTRVVGRQPNAPAAFTPGEIPGTHFQRLSRPQGTWFCRKEPRKKSPVTRPGIDSGTVRLVAQRLNHCATPGPQSSVRAMDYSPVSDRGVMGLVAGHTMCVLCGTWGHRERISSRVLRCAFIYIIPCTTHSLILCNSRRAYSCN